MFPQRKMAASPSVLLWGNDEGLTAPLAAWYSHRGEGWPVGQAWDTDAHLPCVSCITTSIRTAGSVEKAGSIEPALGSTTVAIHFIKKGHLLFSVTTITALSKRDGNCVEGLTWTSGYQTYRGSVLRLCVRFGLLLIQRTQAHPGLRGVLWAALQMFAKMCGLTF